MHLRILFIATFLFLFSCTAKSPEGILSQDKMAAIITDIQLTDAAYKLELMPAAYKNNPEKYYLEILANHQTDSATYNRSMIYYANHPLLLKKIYMKVEMNIQQTRTN